MCEWTKDLPDWSLKMLFAQIYRDKTRKAEFGGMPLPEFLKFLLHSHHTLWHFQEAKVGLLNLNMATGLGLSSRHCKKVKPDSVYKWDIRVFSNFPLVARDTSLCVCACNCETRIKGLTWRGWSIQAVEWRLKQHTKKKAAKLHYNCHHKEENVM